MCLMQTAEQVLEQHDYLVKRAVRKLKIYKNFDDYMQIGRIALWQCITDYDETLGEFEMFAYMRIKYALIRALQRDRKVGEHEVAIEQDDLNFHIDQKQQVRLVTNYPYWFDELKEEERVLLIMHYYEGKTTQEVASKLGYSQEAMKKRKQRLLKKLKPIVKQFEAE